MDIYNPIERSRLMSAVKSANTAPEMAVRRLLHAMAYRYRLHQADLPGRPDIVFRRQRKVIFVHGCFWHGHDCGKGRLPITRTEFWKAKILRNVERDREQTLQLKANGWSVLKIWECETKKRDTETLKEKLRAFLSPGTAIAEARASAAPDQSGSRSKG
ncbi:MAG: very short patch repair endonuclease [Rhizobiaceae bacterium]|nr:very short patch repair endonuclease [Rhizobiaceae bacterium]